MTAAAFLLIAGSAVYLTFDVWVWTSGVLLFLSAISPLLTGRFKRSAQSLYGNSKWATKRNMADSGIVTSRKPM